MEKKYYVYTVIGGYSYVICHDGQGNFEVRNSPADHEVAKWDYETAKGVADRNSNNGIVYKVEEVGR